LFTSTSISISFYAMEPRYLKRVTWGIIWSQAFTSKVELLRLLLKYYIPYNMSCFNSNRSHTLQKLVSKVVTPVYNFTTCYVFFYW